MQEILEVKGLCAGYKKIIISDVSFSVKAGEKIGIIGRNGAGKTTLLRGISGSVRRFSGEIYVKGENIRNMSVKRQASFISLLPQKSHVPEGIYVSDILEMGLYPEKRVFFSVSEDDRKIINEKAEEAGIKDLLDMDFSCLSIGQQQIVLLCRMLIQNTPLMLFDEPDSSLDFINSKKLFETLSGLIKDKNRAGIFVLHNPSSALNFCERLIILNQGRMLDIIDVKEDSPEIIQKKLQKIYPGIRVEKNPYSGGYMCF